MKKVLQVVAAALAVAALIGPQVAAAKPMPHPVRVEGMGGMVKVMKPHHHHHHHHHRWRSFGYYSYGYDQCGRVERSCGYKYGWESHRFYRCVRRNGC